MYNPYIAFVDKYFPYAIAIVNSFHVIQNLETKIMNYLKVMQKGFRMRDEVTKKAKEKEVIHPFNRSPKDMKRTARIYDNFARAKNRLLFSLRDNVPILAVPRSKTISRRKQK